MSVFTVPEMVPSESKLWPSLGPLVVRFIEERLVFGPGDKRGEPAVVDLEKRALIHRMYQVHPAGALGPNRKPIEGRRRFRRCALSLQKGSAKTELAAWIAACELHPEGPVRCSGFDAKGRPIPTSVVDPYIPLVAYTEEQTEDLAYGALKAILELSPIANDFDIGLERIMRRTGDGKAVALAGSPDARDGARTTFQHFDETHRWNLNRLRRAATTMNANLPKRWMADPWGLETTTAYSPGEGSVAEDTRAYADSVGRGEISDSRLFYFHRQAGEYDLAQPEQLRAAVIEAAGPTAAWKDIDGICSITQDPKADMAYFERVYLNRPVMGSAQAFDVAAWKAASDPVPQRIIQPGGLITLGFDGSRTEDATGIVATHVESGYQWVIGLWEKPLGPAGEGWEVPESEVDATIAEAFETYEVWRMYGDPSKWTSEMAAWAGRYGDKKVIAYQPTLVRKMSTTLKAYAAAIRNHEVKNDGSADMARHLGNACKKDQAFVDEDGSPLWLLVKDRPASPNKIDLAMAGAMSWQARLDAVAAGATAAEGSVYDERGMVTV